MMYQGLNIYKFFLDDREIELSKSDIEKIVFEYNEYNIRYSEQISLPNLSSTRKYNKKNIIKSLFLKYYDESKTKKEVFAKISLELKISFKAVEKAYYKK